MMTMTHASNAFNITSMWSLDLAWSFAPHVEICHRPNNTLEPVCCAAQRIKA
jgi:hypothetical protein